MRVQRILRDRCLHGDLADAILNAVGIGDIGLAFERGQAVVPSHSIPVRHAILSCLDGLVRQAEVLRHNLGQIQDVGCYCISLIDRQ